MTRIVKTLVLDGTPQNKHDNCRFRVYINDQEYWLTAKSFLYIVKLAYGRMYGQQGWIYREEIEKGNNQYKYINRMREEVGNIIEVLNDRHGFYRLEVEERAIIFNHKQLHEFPHIEVAEMFR